MKVAEQRLLLLRALRLDTRARTLSLLNCSSNLASSQEGWQGSTSLCLVKPRKGKAIFVNQTAPRYSADLKSNAPHRMLGTAFRSRGSHMSSS